MLMEFINPKTLFINEPKCAIHLGHINITVFYTTVDGLCSKNFSKELALADVMEVIRQEMAQ